MTFKEAVLEFATDVVIVEYVATRPFGASALEIEFRVLDRILGYAPDQIFVYHVLNAHIDVVDISGEALFVDYIPDDLEFHHGVRYLMPLINRRNPLGYTQGAAYALIRNAIIALDDLEESVMYSENLSRHIEEFEDVGKLTEEILISFINELVKDIEGSNCTCSNRK